MAGMPISPLHGPMGHLGPGMGMNSAMGMHPSMSHHAMQQYHQQMQQQQQVGRVYHLFGNNLDLKWVIFKFGLR